MRTPLEFQRPSNNRAPSPENAVVACLALTIRQPTTSGVDSVLDPTEKVFYFPRAEFAFRKFERHRIA